MSTRLTFFGAAGYEIVSAVAPILIDPFLTENPLAPVLARTTLETPDVILVSHAALRPSTATRAAIAKRTGAPVVCDAACGRC